MMGRYLFINVVKPPLKDTPKDDNLLTKDSVLLYIHTPYTLEGNLPTKDSVLLYTLHTLEGNLPTKDSVLLYTLHTHWRTTSLYQGQLSGWVLSMSIIWRFNVYLIVGWLKG